MWKFTKNRISVRFPAASISLQLHVVQTQGVLLVTHRLLMALLMA